MNMTFSLDGKWMTDFIRNRFLYEDMSFDWVIESIEKLLNGNGLTRQRIEQIAQDVILGRSYFKGNTRDGSFVYCDGSDEPIESDFFKKYSNLRDELKKERQARKDAVEAWQELALVIKGEIDRGDCESQSNIEIFKPTPMEEFIDRMIEDDGDIAPYGYISPNGEFHPVDYAEHERFAQDYINSSRERDKILELGYLLGKDYLVYGMGWILLHNPAMGKPIITYGDRPMTKAQREALFDYYTKYGMKKEANALYEDGAQ